jgi:spore cortex formation protein SpoVR/YcgB (stage V sporulation)
MSEIAGERLLFKGADWDFDTLRRIHDACEEIAVGELGLSMYPTRIEVISAEQMLDAYAANGMPVLYRHWSFGKRFARHEMLYRKGMQGLAYEIVINSSPCLCYVMEENTATMQALVIAHAAFGHNHFFRNNHLFLEWTDARGILDYLDFARSYVMRCEDRYGEAAVERVLDAAHALSQQAVFRVPRRRIPDLASEEKRERERRQHEERIYDDLWRTIPRAAQRAGRQGGGSAPPRPAGTAAREHPLLPREVGAQAAPLAAGDPPHRPPRGAVLLSAAPDQGDERGLRHLGAPPHHDPSARAGTAIGRAVPRVPAQPHQRGVPA